MNYTFLVSYCYIANYLRLRGLSQHQCIIWVSLWGKNLADFNCLCWGSHKGKIKMSADYILIWKLNQVKVCFQALPSYCWNSFPCGPMMKGPIFLLAVSQLLLSASGGCSVTCRVVLSAAVCSFPHLSETSPSLKELSWVDEVHPGLSSFWFTQSQLMSNLNTEVISHVFTGPACSLVEG